MTPFQTWQLVFFSTYYVTSDGKLLNFELISPPPVCARRSEKGENFNPRLFLKMKGAEQSFSLFLSHHAEQLFAPSIFLEECWPC